MNKQEIIKLINEKHDVLFDWLDKNGAEHWDYNIPGKWTTGQIVLHLIQSENPLNKALRLPKFFLRYKFGKPNRKVRTYDEIVQRYQEKLKTIDEGIVSPFSKNMDKITNEHEGYIKILKDEHKRLISGIEKRWNEKTLTNYLIPHPLLGRMHVAEILMWTAYHTEHHTKQIIERAAKRV